MPWRIEPPPYLWPFSDPYHSPQTPEEVAEHLAGGGIDALYDLTKIWFEELRVFSTHFQSNLESNGYDDTRQFKTAKLLHDLTKHEGKSGCCNDILTRKPELVNA